jgi:hypothetical protein
MHRIRAKHVIQPNALHKLRRDTQTTGLHGFLHGGMFGLCHQQAFTDTLRVGQRPPRPRACRTATAHRLT